MPLPSWTGNRSLHGSRRASAFTPHWRPKTLGFVACEGRQRQRQQQNGCSRKQGAKVDRGSSPDSLQTSCILTRRWRPLCGDGVPLQQTLLEINVPTNVARCMPQLPSNPIKLTTRINQKRLLIFFFFALCFILTTWQWYGVKYFSIFSCISWPNPDLQRLIPSF